MTIGLFVPGYSNQPVTSSVRAVRGGLFHSVQHNVACYGSMLVPQNIQIIHAYLFSFVQFVCSARQLQDFCF